MEKKVSNESYDKSSYMNDGIEGIERSDDYLTDGVNDVEFFEELPTENEIQEFIDIISTQQKETKDNSMI